jgi:EAL domain-containing protein (putative c-di-GMP-specific phosphodiesterase class I)
VRWEHPQRGLISPSELIPIAEETGLILPLGAWVSEEACRQTRAWQDEVTGRPLMVSVNVSARQFQSLDLVQSVSDVLKRTGLEPGCLKLELTESLMVQDVDRVIERLRELEGFSIQLAVDDFGTGYSSLAYLRRFPISVLKIDQSFVEKIGTDPQDDAIVRSIVTLAHELGMQVIGEGIETYGQLELLRQLDCDYGQGFYFSSPLPAHVAQSLLAAQASDEGRVTLFPLTARRIPRVG